jgi:hypothetical protein
MSCCLTRPVPLQSCMPRQSDLLFGDGSWRSRGSLGPRLELDAGIESRLGQAERGVSSLLASPHNHARTRVCKDCDCWSRVSWSRVSWSRVSCYCWSRVSLRLAKAGPYTQAILGPGRLAPWPGPGQLLGWGLGGARTRGAFKFKLYSRFIFVGVDTNCRHKFQHQIIFPCS